MSIKRTGCFARLTVDNSFLFLFVISVECPRNVLFQAVSQSTLAALLATENTQFETLPNRLIDLLIVKELIDEGKNINQAEIRLPTERSDRLGDRIVTHLQFTIVDHLRSELVQTSRWNRMDLIVREIEFASDPQKIIVELDQLIERQINGENQRCSLVSVRQGWQFSDHIIAQVEHVERIDQ